tara:strand:+ start:2177 stop:2401 length:225 start_codon:yes stop_codon:yes gene_type:complete
MNKKDQAEAIEIMLKNLINMHEKINLILDILHIEESLPKHEPDKDDKIIYFEPDTYKQMCKLIGDGTIPFMGIA